MDDMLNDPRFPDRPSHPDFWRLGESSMQKDGAVREDGKSIDEVASGLIDMESVIYAGMVRAAQAVRQMNLVDEMKRARNNPARMEEILVSVIAGSFMDGVTTGIRFEKAGGHRDG